MSIFKLKRKMRSIKSNGLKTITKNKCNVFILSTKTKSTMFCKIKKKLASNTIQKFKVTINYILGLNYLHTESENLAEQKL